MIELDDAKRQLNIINSDDDQLITDKIAAATAWLLAYTGTADTDSTPAPVMEACRLLVGHLYANREGTLVGVTAQTLPFGVLDMLSPYRAYSF